MQWKRGNSENRCLKTLCLKFSYLLWIELALIISFLSILKILFSTSDLEWWANLYIWVYQWGCNSEEMLAIHALVEEIMNWVIVNILMGQSLLFRIKVKVWKTINRETCYKIRPSVLNQLLKWKFTFWGSRPKAEVHINGWNAFRTLVMPWLY